MDMERGFVKTAAGHMHYRALGTGKPVVLMHINQRSSVMFLGLMAALAPPYRVIAFDHPSHGMSDHIAWQPTITDYARNATEVLDGLGLAQATFLGEAFSALVCMDLATRFPARVEGIVLVNCPYWEDIPTKVAGLAKIKATRPGDATGFPTLRTLDYVLANDPEHAPLHPTQEWMDMINLAQVQAGRNRWQAPGALASYDVPAALDRVACPALVLYGEQFLYARHLAQVVARLRNHRHRLIKDGRFGLCWEHPGPVGEAVREFVG